MTYNVLCERLSPPVMMTFIHQYMVDYTIPYHTIAYHLQLKRLSLCILLSPDSLKTTFLVF